MQGPARFPDLRKNVPHQVRSGAPLRQQQRGEKPARRATHAGDVVGIDVDRVKADGIGGKGDGVGLGDEQSVPEVDYRRILTGTGADEDPGVGDRFLLSQEFFQQRRGNLSRLEKRWCHKRSFIRCSEQ